MAVSRSVLVLCITALFFTTTLQQDINVGRDARHSCVRSDTNRLTMTLRTYDINGIADSMSAVTDDINAIPSCSITGTGASADPFVVVTNITMNPGQDFANACGVRTSVDANGDMKYDWRFKAYASLITRKGFILNVTCTNSDIITNDVDTTVNINLADFFVDPLATTDITGDNSVAVGADIRYTAVVYPNGVNTPTELRDAKGIFLTDCYSATNVNMNANREKFIDENGCPINGADFRPTGGFSRLSDSGTEPIVIRAQTANANTVANKDEYFVECKVWKCTQAGDAFCVNRCDAHNTGATSLSSTPTNQVYTTTFKVQDQDAAAFFPAAANDITPLPTTTVGTEVTLYASLTPGGIRASGINIADLNDAKGYYPYNCRYAFNAGMVDAIQYVDNDGCAVTGTKLSSTGQFVSDSFRSGVNTFVQTYTFPVQQMAKYRFWTRCDTGICIVENHNYCNQRCNAINNFPNTPNSFQNLGYKGHTFTMTVTDPPNQEAFSLEVKDSNGDTVNNVPTGTSVGLTTVTNPGANNDNSGNAGAAAKGSFPYDCVTGPNPTPVVDSEGCRILNSPYVLSQECVNSNEVPNVHPFTANCGTFNTLDSGVYNTTCKIGFCLTENHPACIDRKCGVDVNNDPDINRPDGVTASSSFSVQDAPVQPPRTAIKAEEWRIMIIIITVVLPCALIAVVGFATYCVIKSQKAAV